MCRIILIPHRISLGFPRGPDFDTQLFAERGVTVEKLLGELYEKVYLLLSRVFYCYLHILYLVAKEFYPSSCLICSSHSKL